KNFCFSSYICIFANY
ncbi:unnamed protein product, partial [Leptidea sinapis]